MTGEAGAAAVAARVGVTTLAAWCFLSFGLVALQYAFLWFALVSETQTLGGLPSSFVLALPVAFGVALLAGGSRLVAWSAARAYPERMTNLAGAGWVSFGLPLAALWVVVSELVAVSLALPMPLVGGRWDTVLDHVPGVALGGALLVASPWCARLWARWNS